FRHPVVESRGGYFPSAPTETCTPHVDNGSRRKFRNIRTSERFFAKRAEQSSMRNHGVGRSSPARLRLRPLHQEARTASVLPGRRCAPSPRRRTPASRCALSPAASFCLFQPRLIASLTIKIRPLHENARFFRGST